jgi:copper(I)-binding protein
MLITNGGPTDDRLISVATDVATTAELHETTNAGGMMAMAPVAGITIPANGQAELKTGGYHVMLIDLARELRVGETITLTLTFEKAGELTVTAEVRED